MNDELHPNASSNVPDDSLLALNLSMGDALQLQDTSALKLRYYVKLIGFLNKAGVIVSHPLINGALLPLEVGRSFLVRGFSGRKTYEFNADVLSFSAIPYPHLHLAFPKKVECMTMPGALRIKPESLEGWIEPLRADSVSFKIPMTIIDISTSGARVHVQSKFGNIGDEMKVMFRLAIDEEEQAFSIPAVIRKSYNETLPRGLDGMEGTTHGLEFIQPESSVRMALQGYIYRTMAGG